MPMSRSVFDPGTPQRGRAKQRTTILPPLRGHTPPGGTSAADAMPTSDRGPSTSSGRIDEGSPCTRSVARGPGSPYQRSLRTVWRDRGAAPAPHDHRAAVRTDGPRIQEGMCGMDVMTQIRLLWLGGLGVLYGVALGTVWVLVGWQHRREQRRSRLMESVRGQFPAELRDQIALQIRGMLFARRAVIMVDMGLQAPEAWWSIVAGLSRNLSPDVRRLVYRTGARPFAVTLAITPGRRRGQPSCHLTATA
jgi:hypothetical protein